MRFIDRCCRWFAQRDLLTDDKVSGQFGDGTVRFAAATAAAEERVADAAATAAVAAINFSKSCVTNPYPGAAQYVEVGEMAAGQEVVAQRQGTGLLDRDGIEEEEKEDAERDIKEEGVLRNASFLSTVLKELDHAEGEIDGVRRYQQYALYCPLFFFFFLFCLLNSKSHVLLVISPL